MSGKNTSSKSGSKSCSSPDEYYEDELVTWLQYPLEDSLEKGYCSDLFGQWLPAAPGSATGSRSPPDVGSSKVSSAGTATCTDVGALSRLEGAQVSSEAEMSKERMRNGTLSSTTSVEGALALGAERAAGLASQWGRDAFSKVRTSLQPPGSNLTSPSVTAVGRPDRSMHSSWMAIPTVGGLTSKTPSASAHGGGHHILPRPPLSLTGFTPLRPDPTGAVPQSLSFTAYRPRNVPQDAPLHRPSAQESGCSRIIEGASAHDNVSSASSRANLCGGQRSGTMPARFGPAPGDLHGERRMGVSEMALASSLGPSLSGTTLSTWEASSYSGKRKCEDSESQSVDVDIESSMDVKQPRKASKRNRAAEVHNLSEKNRRNRINEKLRALQDLIPNSSKTDKASVLDEAIDYLKTLQMQLQMVSMRSGMNVSPMMIPVGMPHLQMAPLHPVGLGVPIGYPRMGMGMGMGMHMNMGMGMIEMPQGMMARRPQSVSGVVNQFSMPYQGRRITGSQDSSLDSTNIGSTASQFMPSAQMSPQPFSEMGPVLHSLPSQQQEQWQHAREHAHNVEALEQCNEKVGREG